ncbi:hypothetical protein FRC20_002111 [Serendipita sp. 405]|nr:hypothetical protein FRC15_002284 [Serendipita sp. 397]KAG8850172.1 hypothetical protein FRC20_002111 [Serendipita sp. 405]
MPGIKSELIPRVLYHLQIPRSSTYKTNMALGSILGADTGSSVVYNSEAIGTGDDNAVLISPGE